MSSLANANLLLSPPLRDLTGWKTSLAVEEESGKVVPRSADPDVLNVEKGFDYRLIIGQIVEPLSVVANNNVVSNTCTPVQRRMPSNQGPNKCGLARPVGPYDCRASAAFQADIRDFKQRHFAVQRTKTNLEAACTQDHLSCPRNAG